MTDVYDIRQRRLRDLMRERFKGVQRDLAEAIGREPNYLSRVLSGGPNRKKIGEDFAREIEKNLRLPAGFLDRATDEYPAGRVADKPFPDMNFSEAAMDFAREWDKLREPLRTQILTMVETLVAEQVRGDRRKPGGKPASHPPRPRPDA